MKSQRLFELLRHSRYILMVKSDKELFNAIAC